MPRLSCNSYIKVDDKLLFTSWLGAATGSLQKHPLLSEQLKVMCNYAAVGSKTQEVKEDEWLLRIQRG